MSIRPRAEGDEGTKGVWSSLHQSLWPRALQLFLYRGQDASERSQQRDDDPRRGRSERFIIPGDPELYMNDVHGTVVNAGTITRR